VFTQRHYRASRILNSVQILLLPLICKLCNTFLKKKFVARVIASKYVRFKKNYPILNFQAMCHTAGSVLCYTPRIHRHLISGQWLPLLVGLCRLLHVSPPPPPPACIPVSARFSWPHKLSLAVCLLVALPATSFCRPASLSLLCPMSPARHYHYRAVYFCSLFTMPPLCSFLGTNTTLRSICVHLPMPRASPPRHYHYPAVYFCSLFTLPSVFFLGTTSTLRSISAHCLLRHLCFFLGTTSTLQSISAIYYAICVYF
jgi:hypothetical protein